MTTTKTDVHSQCVLCGAFYFDKQVAPCARCGGPSSFYTKRDLELLTGRFPSMTKRVMHLMHVGSGKDKKYFLDDCLEGDMAA